MNAKKSRSESESDNMIAHKIVRGKFHVGRGEDRVVKVVGDVVYLTKAQAKNFSDIMAPVEQAKQAKQAKSPEPEEAVVETEKAVIATPTKKVGKAG